MASTSCEKTSGPKKKSEKKIASKEEYRLLSNIMGVMNNLRKQVNIIRRMTYASYNRKFLTYARHNLNE